MNNIASKENSELEIPIEAYMDNKFEENEKNMDDSKNAFMGIACRNLFLKPRSECNGRAKYLLSSRVHRKYKI